MQPGSSAPPQPSERRQRLILWLAMLVSLALYPIMMRILPPPQPANNPKLVTTLTVLSIALAAASLPARNRLLARSREAGTLESRQLALMLPIALCEAAALMGLAAWFTTASPRSYYLFAIGFLGMLLHYPRREV